jgi:hypothetical protein
MSTADIRAEVHQIVDRLDENFLKIVHSILDAYLQSQEDDPVVGYDIDGTPKRASVMKEELREEVERAGRGEYISVEELHKKSEQWLNRHIK